MYNKKFLDIYEYKRTDHKHSEFKSFKNIQTKIFHFEYFYKTMYNINIFQHLYDLFL